MEQSQKQLSGKKYKSSALAGLFEPFLRITTTCSSGSYATKSWCWMEVTKTSRFFLCKALGFFQEQYTTVFYM